jgi:uncharacterized peroxidase-related enzyme
MSTVLPVEACRFPLVDPREATNPVVRDVYAEIERELGFGIVPNVFRALAGRPAMLRATWDLFRAVVLEGELPRVIKEMIGIIVSAANRSEYALRVHLHSLGVQGVGQAALAALAEGAEEVPGMAPSVAALLRIAYIAAHQGPLAVSEADLEPARAEGITDEEIGEAFAAIDLFQYVNSFTDLARVPLDAI